MKNLSASQEIRNSGLFDREWYLETYRDVGMSGIPPLEHFVRIGMKIGRDPGPGFDTSHYTKTTPGVADSDMSPIMHYIRVGKSEGRSPKPAATPAIDTVSAPNRPAGSQLAAPTAQPNPVAVTPAGPGRRIGTDAFGLRGLTPMAGIAVVANVASADDRDRVSKVLAQLDQPHDLFVLGAGEADLLVLADHTVTVTDTGPGDVRGQAAAFLRLAASGVFDDYQALLWLSPSDAGDEDNLAPRADLAKPFAEDADWALAGTGTVFLGDEAPQRVKDGLNTALPRLGMRLPADGVQAPDGAAIWIKPILLRALGPAIRPGELDPADQDKGFPGRATVLGFLAAGAREAGMTVAHAAVAKPAAKPVTRDVKAVAFYLPQFHPIPENDLWWGKGFTEWSNVTRGKQLFRGHYQPRVPADLGYYDLRLEDTQVAQADLARAFGVHGFCYYYYWFDGKKLLNQPIEQMARSKDTDAGFCVCWANENWSRNWDGQNRHVLMEQTYSLESNIALMRELIPMMKDPRWIRHNGKPLMMVYRISIIPNWKETAQAWREECRRAGLGEIHLCAVRFGLETLDGGPEEHGLDAYVLFPPHEAARVDLRDKVFDLHKDFGGQIFDYDAVVDGDLAAHEAGYDWPVHRGAMLGWDNTARRLTDARIFHGATPMGFRRWVKGLLEQEARHNTSDSSLVFINAWNEWAEGTYLEPDQRWGKNYLRGLASAADSVPGTRLVTLPKGLSKGEGVGLKPIGDPLVAGGKALAPPVWHQGGRTADPTKPTVLLCAHISGHHLFGGERSLLDVLDALATLDLNVVMTLPSGNNRAYIAEICKRCLGVYAFPYPQWMDNRATYNWLTNTFADIIARHAVDLVHANTIVLSEPLAAARRLGRGTLIHSRELISLDDPLRERMGLSVGEIVREVFRRTDWVIGNSRATCDLFARGDRTFYVPNAVSLDAFDMGNRFGHGIKFGIVSSNIPKKGVADFVEVAARSAPRCERAQFVVIGPETDQTRAWAAEIEAGTRPANLVFAGYRDTPRTAMSELNVLLNLSGFAESFGRTVAEAMAARRPVIAYEWGALPELVTHGETGYLVPYRDIGAVVEAVAALCDNSDQILEMGERGRAAVTESFSQDSLRDYLTRAYETVFNRPLRPDAVRSKTGGDTRSRATVAQRIGAAPPVTVVIPVYNAPDEVRDCLISVIRHTDMARNRVLVIDDGSPDPAVEQMLEEFVGTPGLTIRRNSPNMGYTRTINLGITEAGTDDVVLLNSDTVVTPKWLEGLSGAAYSRDRVATVTAMSDNAGAFSFPTFNAFCPKPDWMGYEDYALLITQATRDCVPPEVPTGSGFCMYIRRDLIDECGLFDVEGFPRGYGEENDFCMRAHKAGWVNLVSPWSFVYHVRTASFKGEKDKLVKAGVDEVTRRYPDYAALVKAAFAGPDMATLREAAARAIMTDSQDAS